MMTRCAHSRAGALVTQAIDDGDMRKIGLKRVMMMILRIKPPLRAASRRVETGDFSSRAAQRDGLRGRFDETIIIYLFEIYLFTGLSG